MRSFLSITDFSPSELIDILDRADELELLWKHGTMPQTLYGERIAMWFCGNGFRNRTAFEIGARSMGADITYIPGEPGAGESACDAGVYLNNWFTMLVVRSKTQEILESVVSTAHIPVINARTDYNHPCEILGDLQYIRQKFQTLINIKVVFVGEVTNLCMSWFEAAVRFPIEVTQVAPRGYLLDEDKKDEMNKAALGRIITTTDIQSAVTDKTDVLYTDCWPRFDDRDTIRKLFLPFQITAAIIERMSPQGIFLPCPPVTRGEEVSGDCLFSDKYQNAKAKECLLYSQSAVMEFLAREHRAEKIRLESAYHSDLTHADPTLIEVLSFIPYFENTAPEEIAHIGSRETLPDGMLSFPYPVYARKFRDFIYEFEASRIPDPNYMENLRNHPLSDPNDIRKAVNKADLALLFSIFTFFIRQERFNEGLWVTAVKTGIFLHILRRIEALS